MRPVTAMIGCCSVSRAPSTSTSLICCQRSPPWCASHAAAAPNMSRCEPHNPTHPVDDQNDLRRLLIDVGNHLLDKDAHDTLLQSCIGLGISPDSLEIHCKRGAMPER